MRKKLTIDPESARVQIVPERVELPDVKERVAKFKKSGHSVDQQLLYNSPDQRGQGSLFDTLSPIIKNQIREKGQDEIVVQGIRLSPAEDRLLNAVQKIFWDKSTQDKHGKLIRAGNRPAHRDQYGGENTDFPTLAFSAAELYKEYTCSTDYAGSEIQYIKDTIHKLQEKRFLIIYKRKYTLINAKGKAEEREQRIEEYLPLLKIVKYFDLSKKEAEEIDNGNNDLKEQKGEVIIILNPIFIDQIDTKFIEYPVDINRRTAIAAGGHGRVTQSINNLRDYLLRAISANKGKLVSNTEINTDKLPFLLGLDKYIKQRKRKLMDEIITKSIVTVVNMGLASSFEHISGANGQDKIIFNLNLDY